MTDMYGITLHITLFMVKLPNSTFLATVEPAKSVPVFYLLPILPVVSPYAFFCLFYAFFIYWFVQSGVSFMVYRP